MTETWTFVRCSARACGLVWLNPQPIPEDIGLAYQGDYYTHADREPPSGFLRRLYYAVERGYVAHTFGYTSPDIRWWQILAGRVLGWFPVRRTVMDLRAMHLAAESRGRLLEIGCGSGRHLAMLAQLGWHVEGLDFDRAAVDVARSRGLTVACGAIEDQRYPSDSFDAVVMCHVIEHLFDPIAVLRECHRVLRPSGRLVVLTPNTHSLLHGEFGASWFPLEPPRHITMFHRALLGRQAEHVGFAIDRLATTARSAGSLWTLSKRIQRTGVADIYRPSSWTERPAAFLAGWRAWAKNRASPDLGEELLLVARKRPV